MSRKKYLIRPFLDSWNLMDDAKRHRQILPGINVRRWKLPFQNPPLRQVPYFCKIFLTVKFFEKRLREKKGGDPSRDEGWAQGCAKERPRTLRKPGKPKTLKSIYSGMRSFAQTFPYTIRIGLTSSIEWR
jgi:hypothetical protein